MVGARLLTVVYVLLPLLPYHIISYHIISKVNDNALSHSQYGKCQNAVTELDGQGSDGALTVAYK